MTRLEFIQKYVTELSIEELIETANIFKREIETRDYERDAPIPSLERDKAFEDYLDASADIAGDEYDPLNAVDEGSYLGSIEDAPAEPNLNRTDIWVKNEEGTDISSSMGTL